MFRAISPGSLLVKTLTFEVTINAPRTHVWDTMLGPETYKAWTSAFSEVSHYTGSWDQGAQIRFLGPAGDGSPLAFIARQVQNFDPMVVAETPDLGRGG